MEKTTSSRADIADWRPEEDAFWESTGKRIAYLNLWISIPALLCGFAVWGMWGVITVQMLNLGFPFSQAELFTLTAIAGISGATMRIPASFLIRLAGGRNTIFLTTAMLLSPAIGTGIALHASLDKYIHNLGQRASAGCIRLLPSNAEKLYKLLQTKYAGMVPNTSTSGRVGVNVGSSRSRGAKALVIVEDLDGAALMARSNRWDGPSAGLNH